ncbi:hypothetical protein ACL07V_15200 [Streptomyces sp. MB22_4]|uniref:hypothetical protein n=1 Tax=Streptomyces sp. MB22_4 TaxID=3383120 RepID=UPI0039A08AD7
MDESRRSPSGAGAPPRRFAPGESEPVEVRPGSAVVGGAVDAGGPLFVRATAVGADTRLARITLGVDAVTVPAGGALSMSPHRVDVTLRAGAGWRTGYLVPFTLHFERGAPVEAIAAVVRPGDRPS